jgi:hypothetical protein
VRAGEAISIHVHSAAGAYDAQLVRLIHGDENPAGPAFKEVLIYSLLNGRHRGESRRIAKGFCAVVALPPELRAGARGWSISVWVWPTLMDGTHGLLASGDLALTLGGEARARSRAGAAEDRRCRLPRPGLRPGRALPADRRQRRAALRLGVRGWDRRRREVARARPRGRGLRGRRGRRAARHAGAQRRPGELPATLRLLQFVVEETLATTPWSGGRDEPRLRADIVLLAYPNGGAVFSVGSILWCSTLSAEGYGSDTSRITENVIERFLRGDWC